MVKLKVMKKVVFRFLLDEYEIRGYDFHIRPTSLKIDGMGKKRIGRACAMLEHEGLLERRNNKPSPPVYRTNFKHNKGLLYYK